MIEKIRDINQIEGRIQTLDEAKSIDISIKNILKTKCNDNIVFSDVTRDNAINCVIDDLRKNNPEMF